MISSKENTMCIGWSTWIVRAYNHEISACWITEVKAAGSTFGTHFRVTTYGESHGGGVGCVVDGVPPRRSLSEADLQGDLDRRYLKLWVIFFVFIL